MVHSGKCHTTVINYSLSARSLLGTTSDGTSAVKEPGHFEVRKSSSQVIRMHCFPQKKLTTFFSCRPQNTGRQRRFTVKIKQIKRSDMTTFFYFLPTLYIAEAKQYAGTGRAGQGGDLPARLFDLAHPGVAPPLRTTVVRLKHMTSTKFCIHL